MWADIDLRAVRANIEALMEAAAPAAVMAVVKADGYGHGAVDVGRAALDAGASWLGVALVEEGLELREAGICAPILVLSEPPAEAASVAVAASLTPVVYTEHGIEALARAVAEAGRDPLPVHIKIDTGMHRVGCAPARAVSLAQVVHNHSELTLEGVCTHFAVADEPGNPYTSEQLHRFRAALTELEHAGLRPPIVHAANSAATVARTDARFDLVRAGIAVYGIPPAPVFDGRFPLRPALSLRAQVSHVFELAAGASVSYGLRYRLTRSGRIAVVPIGYADGVPRVLGARGGQVLIGGVRHPIAGTITMDQLCVDVRDHAVEPGDEVVLLGRQGDEEITAGEWAARVDTIPYEIVCGIGPRVPRRAWD